MEAEIGYRRVAIFAKAVLANRIKSDSGIFAMCCSSLYLNAGSIDRTETHSRQTTTPAQSEFSNG